MKPLNPPWSDQAGWHRAAWGPLGWAETAVKLVAIAVATVAAIDGGRWSIPGTHRLPYWILAAIAAGYVVTTFDRWLDREVVAMVFVILMVVGHWSLVYAMGAPEWPSVTVRVFAGLMAAGDVIKVAYFWMTRARVRDLPPSVPILMTGVLVLAYLVAFLAA